MSHEPMNRAERRKQERQQRRDFATLPEWKKAEIAAKAAYASSLARNGITEEDLDKAYRQGMADMQKKYVAERLDYMQKFFYSACAIAAHNLFGFGKTRGERLLEETERIMTEEITTEDIIQRCKRETGIDIMEGGYTI